MFRAKNIVILVGHFYSFGSEKASLDYLKYVPIVCPNYKSENIKFIRPN